MTPLRYHPDAMHRDSSPKTWDSDSCLHSLPTPLKPLCCCNNTSRHPRPRLLNYIHARAQLPTPLFLAFCAAFLHYSSQTSLLLRHDITPLQAKPLYDTSMGTHKQDHSWMRAWIVGFCPCGTVLRALLFAGGENFSVGLCQCLISHDLSPQDAGSKNIQRYYCFQTIQPNALLPGVYKISQSSKYTLLTTSFFLYI